MGERPRGRADEDVSGFGLATGAEPGAGGDVPGPCGPPAAQPAAEVPLQSIRS